MGITNNNSIEKVFSTIMQDENLQQELTKKKTIDEVYDFCISISEGYTIDELKDFLSKAEEKFMKVSGGIKLNNKALSTVLATMAMASPLAGAAGQTQGQPQPSKGSGFIKMIKDKVSQHPVGAAMGGVATAGGLTLAAIKLFGGSSSKKDNGGSNDTSQTGAQTAAQNSVKPVNPTGGGGQPAAQNRAVPSYLDGISPDINRFDKINQEFLNLGANVNGKTPKVLSELVNAVAPSWGIYSHANAIKKILYAIDGRFTGDMKEFHFYLNMGQKQVPIVGPIEILQDISNLDLAKLDTSSINVDGFENLIIKYSTKRFGDKTPLDLTNEQKVIIIRYVQANYLHEKGKL